MLDDLFNPILQYLCRTPFPTPDSLLPGAKLFNLAQTPMRLRSHLRAQLANYLSHSLQSTFPNMPTVETTALLQTFHDINDLAPALSLAARHAPFLPLLHGIIGALETRLDDVKLAAYVNALPVASAGINRLLACDAATARWPARAVRVAAAVATLAASDVARATFSLRIGTAMAVVLAEVSLSLSAARDAQGIAVSVHLRHGLESSSKDDWRGARIGVRGAACVCACTDLVEGGDIIFVRGDNNAARSGVMRLDGEAVRQWKDEHGNCNELLLSVDIELFKGRAAIFMRARDSDTDDDSKRQGSLASMKDKNSTKMLNPNGLHDPSLTSVAAEPTISGATNTSARDERVGASNGGWFGGL